MKFLAHAQSCEDCRKELIASARLRETLAELEEVEPPDGLAQSAINKAKKPVKIPAFAYISVAVAAVVAVAFFATSSVLGPKTRTVDESMQVAENEKMFKTNSEGMDEDFGAGLESSDMPEEAAMAQNYAEDDTLDTANSERRHRSGRTTNFATAVSELYIRACGQGRICTQQLKSCLEENGIYTLTATWRTRTRRVDHCLL